MRKYSDKAVWLFLSFMFLHALTVSGQWTTSPRGLPLNAVPEDVHAAMTFYTGEVDAESIRDFMQALQDFETRFALAPNRREVATWIRDMFVSFGYTEARLDSFLLNYTYRSVPYETWQYNVIAEQRGYHYPDSIHILGAHYDSIVTGSEDDPFKYAPGADDNASGVAALLETARLFKKHGYESANTIQFIAYGAEELGLHGSWHHARRSAEQNKGIVMMINNDMISHTDQPEALWTLEVQYYPGSDWLTDLAVDVAVAYTGLNVVKANNVIRFTDSWPYHSVGYDAVFLHEERFSPFYHSPQDVVENTNKRYAAEMVKVSVGMLVSQNGPGTSEAVSAVGGPDPGAPPYRLFVTNRRLHLWFDEARPDHPGHSVRLLRIYDTSGRLLQAQQLDVSARQETYLSYGPGIYLVQVVSEKETITEKILLP